MKIALRVLGILLMVMGTVWFLQGANVLTAGNSPMSRPAKHSADPLSHWRA